MAAEPIQDVVMNTKLPVSGYFGFDEIHTRTNGEKTYILSLVDLWDGFYVNAEFSPEGEAGAIKQFFSSSKRQGKIKFKGLVLDGLNRKNHNPMIYCSFLVISTIPLN